MTALESRFHFWQFWTAWFHSGPHSAGAWECHDEDARAEIPKLHIFSRFSYHLSFIMAAAGGYFCYRHLSLKWSCKL